MPCYNWQGEEAIHFRLPTACDMMLMVRTSYAFEMEEYFLHMNSIMNQDPANVDTFFIQIDMD